MYDGLDSNCAFICTLFWLCAASWQTFRTPVASVGVDPLVCIIVMSSDPPQVVAGVCPQQSRGLQPFLGAIFYWIRGTCSGVSDRQLADRARPAYIAFATVKRPSS